VLTILLLQFYESQWRFVAPPAGPRISVVEVLLRVQSLVTQALGKLHKESGLMVMSRRSIDQDKVFRNTSVWPVLEHRITQGTGGCSNA